MTAYFKWEDEVFIFWFLSKTSISFSQLCELCEPLYVSLNTWVYSRFFPVDQVLIWFILPPLCHLITSRLPPLTPSVTPAGGHIVLSDTTCHVSSQQRRGNIKQSNQSINQSINQSLFVSRQFTTNVISWHFPNAAGLDHTTWFIDVGAGGGHAGWWDTMRFEIRVHLSRILARLKSISLNQKWPVLNNRSTRATQNRETVKEWKTST